MEDAENEIFHLLVSLTPEWKPRFSEPRFHKNILHDLHKKEPFKMLRGESTHIGFAVDQQQWLAFCQKEATKNGDAYLKELMGTVRRKIEEIHGNDFVARHDHHKLGYEATALFNLLVALTPRWKEPFSQPHFQKRVLEGFMGKADFKRLRGEQTQVGWAVNLSQWREFLINQRDVQPESEKWLEHLYSILRQKIEASRQTEVEIFQLLIDPLITPEWNEPWPGF